MANVRYLVDDPSGNPVIKTARRDSPNLEDLSNVRLQSLGATVREAPHDVGEGIKVGDRSLRQHVRDHREPAFQGGLRSLNCALNE